MNGMTDLAFRPYEPRDQRRCVAMFDANTPEFFSPNERVDYLAYLDGGAAGYRVCEEKGRVVGAFGLSQAAAQTRELNWILIDPGTQGQGIGSRMLERVVEDCRGSDTTILRIAASHRSAPFFERFGATVVRTTENGWGPGMHRVDMRLDIGPQAEV